MKIQINPDVRDVLPCLSTDEYERLRADIAANGIQSPLIVAEDGDILDGMHRFAIAEQDDIADVPHTVKTGFDTLAKKQAECSRINFNRRNLTGEQKKEHRERQMKIAAELKAPQGGGLSQEEIARRLGVAQKTISLWLETSGSISSITNASTSDDIRVYDNRVSVPKDQRKQIRERVESGETQAQVAADYGVTRRRIGQIVQQEQKKEKGKQLKQPELPPDIFSVIYADPPWKYSNEGFEYSDEQEYLMMATDDICNLDIKSHVYKNAILFLWVTNPLLLDGLRVLDAWGFQYKTNLVWVKNIHSFGFYVLGKHELLLIGVRGSMTPKQKTAPMSVLESPRRKHSQKPDEMYDIIERMYPEGKYLEMFARRTRDGWTSWGNEVGRLNS